MSDRHIVAATLVVGTAALGATLATPRGSVAFTVLGILVAVVWLGGSARAGPVPLLGRPVPDRRDVIRVVGEAVALGVLAYLGFLAAAVVARRIPVLDGAVDSVLDRAEAGSLAVVLTIALLNAVGEEAFFRGALLGVIPDGPVLTIAIYALVTAASGNLALVLAALVMGTVFTVERLRTGGVLSPAVTHVTWSILVLLAFPR